MLRRVLRAALAGLCFVLAAAPAAAMTVRPATFDELVDHAAVVFEGECTENRAERDPQTGMAVTYTTFAVRDVLKGSAAATHTIKQVGGSLPGEQLSFKVPGVPKFAPGESYIVFLPGASSAGFSSPVAMQQGRFGVRQGPGGRRVSNGRDFREMTANIPRSEMPGPAAAALAAAPGQVLDLGIEEFKQLVRARAGRAR